MVSGSGGRKYGVTTRTDLWAQEMACSATYSICSMSSSGPEVTTRANTGPAFSSGGNQFSVSKLLAGGVQPIVGEGAGQLLDDRALELEVGVVHDEGRVVGADVLGADVDAAGEADAAVDHQYLAMAAQVHEGHAPGKIRMQEARDRARLPLCR